jgi:hypothetical protein
VAAAPGILDLVGNSFTGPYTRGEAYTIDKIAPAVASISLAGPNPTGANTVNFIVIFSELVTNLDAADFNLASSGLSGTAVTQVSGGPAIAFLVAAGTGTGNGMLRLDIVAAPGLQDLAGNHLAGPYTGEATCTIEKTAPGVLSITRAGPNPAKAGRVDFIVSFSEPVTGVDPSDFLLTTNGLGAAAVTGVSGGPASLYIVTVDTGSGSGTLRLDVRDNDSIIDVAGNALGGAGAGNGNFTAGEVYNIYIFRIFLPLILR